MTGPAPATGRRPRRGLPVVGLHPGGRRSPVRLSGSPGPPLDVVDAARKEAELSRHAEVHFPADINS